MTYPSIASHFAEESPIQRLRSLYESKHCVVLTGTRRAPAHKQSASRADLSYPCTDYVSRLTAQPGVCFSFPILRPTFGVAWRWHAAAPVNAHCSRLRGADLRHLGRASTFAAVVPVVAPARRLRCWLALEHIIKPNKLLTLDMSEAGHCTPASVWRSSVSSP